MNEFIFTVDMEEITLNDLGQSMNTEFEKLYRHYLVKDTFNKQRFETESSNFFDKNVINYQSHDAFFENFTIAWRKQLIEGRFAAAEQLWEIATEIAKDWESKNHSKRIHKGAAYYFWGFTCILKEDFEKGFLLMHQSLDEDKRNTRIDFHATPAYAFVTLDFQKQDQLFKNKVLEITGFLHDMIQRYNKNRSGKLTLADLKSRLLQKSLSEEQAFLFVFELFQVKKLLAVNNMKLTYNDYGSLLLTETMFNICIILDNLIKEKNPAQWKYSEHLSFISQKMSLNLGQANIVQINVSFKTNFSRTLENLLSSQYTLASGLKLNPIEEDLAITYGVRNFGAHKIENQPVIYQNLQTIVERCLNAIFFTIESLY
jgi:hypothetical protein